MLNNSNSSSNHHDLKMTFWAELVPKSFSTNVAAPIAAANRIRYSPAAEVEKRLFEILCKNRIAS